jgi:hypothetical protein
MPLDRLQLREISTADLKVMFNQYKQIRQGLRTRWHSSRATTYTTDQGRCRQAMENITLELRARARKTKPLKEFEN